MMLAPYDGAGLLAATLDAATSVTFAPPMTRGSPANDGMAAAWDRAAAQPSSWQLLPALPVGDSAVMSNRPRDTATRIPAPQPGNIGVPSPTSRVLAQTDTVRTDVSAATSVTEARPRERAASRDVVTRASDIELSADTSDTVYTPSDVSLVTALPADAGSTEGVAGMPLTISPPSSTSIPQYLLAAEATDFGIPAPGAWTLLGLGIWGLRGARRLRVRHGGAVA
jgi:hypothetical protein